MTPKQQKQIKDAYVAMLFEDSQERRGQGKNCPDYDTQIDRQLLCTLAIELMGGEEYD